MGGGGGSMTAPVLKLTPTRPPAPEHLTVEAAAIWTATTSDFDFEPHELVTLRVAMEAWDRAQAARRYLDEHGPTFLEIGRAHV